MSFKVYKNITQNRPQEDSLSHHSSVLRDVYVTQGIGSNLKSSKFFYITGLIIFLYGGLKILDYHDRYTGETILPQLAIEKILMPFVPQLLTAKETTNNDKQNTIQAEEGGANKNLAVDEKIVGIIDGEKKEAKKNTSITEGDVVSTETVKEAKEAFFDPLGITSASEVRLLEALGTRRMQLEARDKATNKRELELELFEKKLQEKWETLQTIQEEVKRQLGQLDKGEIAKEQSLSKVYENMKPKDAARVFDLLNLSVVMKILSHMKEKKISEIMGFLSTERARDITQELAFKSKSLARPAPKT